MRIFGMCLLVCVVAFPTSPPISDQGVAPKPAATYSTTINFCLSEIRASFATLDANGDGVLSQAELGIALGLTPATTSTVPAATTADLATPSSAASATSSDVSPSTAAVDAAPAASATAAAPTVAPAAPTEVAAVSATATEATTAEPASSAVLEASPPPPSPEATLPPPPAAAAATTRDVLITVPAGVVAGQQLIVTSPFGGSQLRITVPAGAPAH